MMNLASTSDVLRIVTGTPRDAILAGGKLRVVGYAPIKPRRKAVPPPLFRETVHWGDN